MVYRIIHVWATIFLRLYFRKTIVYGLEHVPAKGPLILASNHPSAFLEASLVATVLRRPLHFLVRGDMFHPRFRWLFDWTNQIPIYRQKDGISNLRKNASSFELTYRKLAEGQAVMIFPEAKTILEKRMRPIQRGTAHLAFGTIPFLKAGDVLPVLPVGVNFTEPRIPGTDVVIRFGPSFITERATREDREAIDRFTETLSEALSPLVVHTNDDPAEEAYDVLASVYLRCSSLPESNGKVHDDLVQIAAMVNEDDKVAAVKEDIQQYRAVLKRNKMKEAVYFPEMILMNRLSLFILSVLKLVWMISGGWIWRSVRHLIYKKISKSTFQSPVAVGAAMVIFPLLSLIFLLVCLVAGWPTWILPVWLLVMMLGMFFRPPFYLMWKLLIMKPGIKSGLKKFIRKFQSKINAQLLST